MPSFRDQWGSLGVLLEVCLPLTGSHGGVWTRRWCGPVYIFKGLLWFSWVVGESVGIGQGWKQESQWGFCKRWCLSGRRRSQRRQRHSTKGPCQWTGGGCEGRGSRDESWACCDLSLLPVGWWCPWLVGCVLRVFLLGEKEWHHLHPP